MQTTLTREFSGVNLDILVDYDQYGVCVEDILHRGESIIELLTLDEVSSPVIISIRDWAVSQHDKLLESDEYARADDLNDYRKD